LIIDYINWRGIFFFLVPIGLVGIALTYMRFALSREPETARRSVRVDYLGAALFVMSTVTLALLLDRRAAEVIGVGHRGFLTFALGGALLGFLVRETRAPSPIMNLHLFKIRMFAYSIVSVLLLHTIHGLVDFILPFYLQEILQLSPSLMGVMFLAPPIFTITLATVSGHIADKVGPRVPATIGVLATIAALFIGANLRIDSLWILPTVMLAFRGISTAFFSSPNHAALVGSVPIEDRGFATGMLHTVVGLGNLVGISLGGGLLALGFRYYSGIPETAPDPGNASAFVSAMNLNYLIAIGVGLVTLLASIMRGGAKIEAHPGVRE
jgi:MFS family permease